jgi:hypothetical protein
MAYSNLKLPISVVDAASSVSIKVGTLANGVPNVIPLYNNLDGKYPQQELLTKSPDGKMTTHLMAEIDYSDLKILFDELDIALRLQSPIVQNLFAKNAKEISNLVRVVNYNTRSGFKGSAGAGNQLDTVLLRAEQFQNPDAAGVAARASFNRAIGAAGTLQFICQPDALGANAHAALTLTGTPAGSNNEGLMLLGFENTSATPLTSAFQIQYLGVNYNIQNLGFEMVNAAYGDSIVELKQPLIIYPGENALVNVRYFANGNDELRPIGLWVKTSTNLRALATS